MLMLNNAFDESRGRVERMRTVKTVRFYMNCAFCALAVISLVGITVAILLSM